MSPLLASPLLLAGLFAAAPEGHRTTIVGPEDDTTPAIVVPREELEEPGVGIAEALGRLPGVRTSLLGGVADQARILVRGAAFDQLRVFVDGIPLDRADGGSVDLSHLPPWHAGQVSLWRSHAPMGRGGGIAGALELRSRWSDGSSVEGMVEAASFGTTRLGIYGAVASDDGDRHGVVSVERLQTRGDYGWPDDQGTLFDTSDDMMAVRENNDATRWTAMAQAGLRVGACALRLVDHTLWLDRGLPGPASVSAMHVRHRTASHLAGARIACRRQRAWHVAGVASVGWLHLESDDPFGELSLIPTAAVRDAFRPSASVTAGFFMHPRLRLDAHGEGRRESYRVEDQVNPARDDEVNRSQGAAALGVRWSVPGTRLIFAPRIRVQRFEDDSGDGQTAGTWLAATSWSPEEAAGARLRLAVGTGVREPTLYELYGDGGLVLPSAALEPEKGLTASTSIDWSAKDLPAHGRVDVQASAFYSDMEDFIAFRRNSLWNAVAQNVAGATLAGAEWRLRLDVFQHLRATWSHTSLWTQTDSEEVAHDKKALPLRPPVQDDLRLEGYLRDAEGSGWRVIGDIKHVASNTYDAAGLVRAPARWLLGAGVGWHMVTRGLVGLSGGLDVGVTVQNVLDSHPVDLLGYPLPGRQWSVRVAWQESVF